MNSKIMEKYYEYMRETRNLSVGTYEVNQLAEICGIRADVLVFLGARANALQAPIAIKDGWYIYKLDERYSKDKFIFYITIDNNIKYI